MSDQNIETMLNHFRNLAGSGEIHSAEMIDTTVYAFGSEIGALRLLAANRNIDTARVGYSKNLDAWYFAFDRKF